MSLTKFFNMNYLKENIKKSRGIIIILTVVVPILTILMTLFRYDTDKYIRLLNMADVSWGNIIGMYIIPLLLSLALFGYVYKKKSVDFVNSMPMSRKTIFITNTVAGIFIISIIQILTMLGIFIIAGINPNLQIIPEMIFDTSVLMWISYIFVFTATNLAMTFCGTFFAQLVLTAVILMIIPFSINMYNVISSKVNNYENISSGNEIIQFADEEENEYTMPYNVIKNILKINYSSFSSNENIFANRSLEMGLLSIIYFALGGYFFEKRKMENSEQGFSKDYVHLIIKSLTVYPIVLVYNTLYNLQFFHITFFIALIIVYWIIYDFIARRKIKFLKSAFTIILTLLISQSIYYAMRNVPLPSKKDLLTKDNVKEVAIVINNMLESTENNIYIQNDELINLIFDSSEITSKEMKLAKEAKNSEEVVEFNKKIQSIYLNLKTKQGKEFHVSTSIQKEDYEKILEILNNNQEYMNQVKERYFEKAIYLTEDRRVFENSEEMNEQMALSIKEMNLSELIALNSKYSSIEIKRCNYENNKLVYQYIPIIINSDIFKTVAEYENNNISKYYEDYKTYADWGYNFSCTIVAKDSELTKGDYEKFKEFNRFSTIETQEKIKKFIEENRNEKVDISKKCYVIFSEYKGSLGTNFYLYTNKTEEIDNIIQEEIELNRK